MSQESDDFLKNLDIENEKENALERRKKAVQEKDLTLREHRVERDLDELIRNNNNILKAQKVGFSRMTPEAIALLVASNDEYMIAAKNAMLFINKDFGNLVPYFRKNLIIVGGDTGDGKSTSVANIVYNTITNKNPATGKFGRVLVLSNEEAPEDFYNRITCFHKGWKYSNHDQFTDEQRKVFSQYIPIWAQDGRLTIIGDLYEGVDGWTTTPEGIETIFNNLIRDGANYDTILLDYYQNVNKSQVDPKLDEYHCQRKLSSVLDRMKLRYPGAIVIMAQMKKLTGEDDTTPFNVRLKGSKLICDKATFICELIPERKLLRSKWFVWKSRFTDAVGNFIYTGFDKGRFVPYSVEFQKNIAKLVERNAELAAEQELGIPNEGPVYELGTEPDGKIEPETETETENGETE